MRFLGGRRITFHPSIDFVRRDVQVGYQLAKGVGWVNAINSAMTRTTPKNSQEFHATLPNRKRSTTSSARHTAAPGDPERIQKTCRNKKSKAENRVSRETGYVIGTCAARPGGLVQISPEVRGAPGALRAAVALDARRANESTRTENKLQTCRKLLEKLLWPLATSRFMMYIELAK